MVNKYKNRISSTIQEYRMGNVHQNTKRYHVIPARMALIKKTDSNYVLVRMRRAWNSHLMRL